MTPFPAKTLNKTLDTLKTCIHNIDSYKGVCLNWYHQSVLDYPEVDIRFTEGGGVGARMRRVFFEELRQTITMWLNS